MAEVQELESPEVGELEAVEEQIAAKQTSAAPPEADLPEKYKGKSVVDIVKMHQEAERLIGRQAQEVGEVRKLADELLRSQLKPKEPEVQPPKEVDFFENPQEAIKRAVETNPAVLEARQYAIQAQRTQAVQQLQQTHPDFQQIVKDQDFLQWVGASAVRQKLMREADAYDFTAANELLSTFKEIRQLKQQRTAEVDTKARDSALKAAAVETGGSGESGRKVYRRADLIRLKMRDPGKYEAMQDEILSAYAEGRVK